ncbi:glucose/arabinose dehydrogenase [Pontibacter ummariensis]|uniref:Glucose/arabinose dehydrogenase, beta-propeller fold n=2 Tax=Pontibacter ummariensis TaxID=1610492 RepID=A0A239G3Y1_9BACT|nr:glucose/arabinose dehydrogenase [Pontibacter ummariensis]SNS63418.1 Glucose/arabinose dehydrogenase, beta-propeller fold [Pontibacter ummariensis]
MMYTMKKHTSKKALRNAAFRLFLSAVTVAGVGATALAQESPKEEDFFRITGVSTPEDVLLEVGGLTVLPNGDLGISTRRGDVYIVENPTSPRPYFRKFATGLHEILGLAYKDGALYAAQRGELTKLVDKNMDGKADVYETVYNWPLSGHYHEYSFGPKIAPDGTFFVSGNVAFGDEQWYRGESRVPWRGWVMNINEKGQMQPWATGVRSPAGLGMIDGELFYTDNQGDWIGSGGLWHLTKGAFVGHPAGLRWTNMPNSPLKLTPAQQNAVVDGREIKDENGRYIKPENIVNEDFTTLFEAKERIPELKLPAVWLPHGILGVSNSEPIKIPEENFGPFGGQILVGDQGMSLISRVFLEKVNGEYQGAAFPFRSGFQSGVLRMAWAPDGSLFVGETNRGWGSAGDENQGLQRLVWNNAVPFEMRAVRAMPDGFEIEFTQPVDKESAEDIASYSVSSFIYKYHPVYGSPPVSTEENPIKGVKVSEDGMKARILVDNMRRYHIHTISLDGVRARDNSYSLVHPTAYYTLNNIPAGQKLSLSEVSTKNSAAPKASAPKKAAPKTSAVARPAAKRTPAKAVAAASVKAPVYADVKGILAKYTCLACHSETKKQIGPAYVDVAKRNYSNEKIVELIHNPQPKNWPDYATEMPPMPQVPKEDALKIAAWINSLK